MRGHILSKVERHRGSGENRGGKQRQCECHHGAFRSVEFLGR